MRLWGQGVVQLEYKCSSDWPQSPGAHTLQLLQENTGVFAIQSIHPPIPLHHHHPYITNHPLYQNYFLSGAHAHIYREWKLTVQMQCPHSLSIYYVLITKVDAGRDWHGPNKSVPSPPPAPLRALNQVGATYAPSPLTTPPGHDATAAYMPPPQFIYLFVYYLSPLLFPSH